jgi:hypothetical protein
MSPAQKEQYEDSDRIAYWVDPSMNRNSIDRFYQELP